MSAPKPLSPEERIAMIAHYRHEIAAPWMTG